MSRRPFRVAALTAIACLAYVPFVLADAWISAPSGVRAGTELAFSGGGMPADASVLVMITDPNEVFQSFVLAADDQGAFGVKIPAKRAGEYRAEVWNATGTDPDPLATFTVPVAP